MDRTRIQETIRSCDPTGEHDFQFHYGLNMPEPPIFELELRKLLLKPAEIVLRMVTWLLPKQRNSIAMIAERPKNHPWSMNPPLVRNPTAKTKKQFRSESQDDSNSRWPVRDSGAETKLGCKARMPAESRSLPSTATKEHPQG